MSPSSSTRARTTSPTGTNTFEAIGSEFFLIRSNKVLAVKRVCRSVKGGGEGMLTKIMIVMKKKKPF